MMLSIDTKKYRPTFVKMQEEYMYEFINASYCIKVKVKSQSQKSFIATKS